MGTEPRVVQLLDGILHVLVAEELYHASAILEHIGIAHITSFPHVILQVLPTATWGQP